MSEKALSEPSDNFEEYDESKSTNCERCKLEEENTSSGADIDKEFLPSQCKLEEENPFFITDLPEDFLVQIFSKINIWNHHRIRATCKCFQEVQNQYLNREFNKAIYEFSKNGKEFSARILTCIKEATKVYVNIGGYESVLYDCLLPVLRLAYQTPFDLKQQNIKVFLTSFFTAVTSMDKPGSYRAMAMYTLTVLGLLKSFDRYEFTITESDQNLLICIIVPDIWIGPLNITYAICEHGKSNGILVILTLLLIGSPSVQTLKYVYEFDKTIFLFGSNAADGIQQNKTEFKINMWGSENIRLYVKNWMNKTAEQDNDELLDNLSSEQFQFDMEIVCKSASYWGCPSSTRVNFVPKM